MVGTRAWTGGPLEPLRDGIVAELAELGYSDGRAGQLLLVVAHLSCWLEERGFGAGDLSGEVVADFFVTFRRSWCRSPRSLAPVLTYLRAIGVAPVSPAVRVGRSAVEVELWESYRRWCVEQRGLRALTVDGYVRRAEGCLRTWRPDGEIVVADLDGAAVLAAVRAAADTLPGPSLRCTVTALRSLLRFLHATGRTRWPLVGAVPAMKAPVRMIGPSPVSEAAAAQMVASCDTTTRTGRRDAAILVVLARLGLRAKEVAALTLDGVDWRRGELSVDGKGGRVEILPIPVDVGEAVTGYLTGGRPVTTCRALFVKATAPFGPMSADGVAAVVRLSCGRAGLPGVGPHRLRRMVATETLRAGAPLAEVAQLLRHADIATSAIYAVADPVSVAALARPWPGSGQ
ncbi:MAG TPA: tyrosine-type recombinase/integrase [Acidimicrobiales bacterium]|nr:tyrosine-type recombinase/integrase [Acidimicrobiales bacterium]